LKLFDLILYRTIAELKSEGTRTYAGYLWWIFEPLMSLLVYYVAFKYILNRSTENFAIFLFIGIVVYRFFSGTVIRSAMSIYRSSGLIQLVYVHKIIFPLSAVMVNLIKFLITLLLVIIVAWLAGIPPTWAFVNLPILILVLLIFITGISLICAAITPFFPDYQIVLSTFVHLLFFLSGIFFDVSNLSPKLQSIIRLNPLATIIEQFRIVLLHGLYPSLELLFPAMIASIIFFYIGWLMIHKFNRYFAKLC
jgi:lipopolysaccharide transport system permease protein